MDCNKWEDAGLLYCSDELGEIDKKAFEQHLNECPVCNEEFKCYTKEKEAYYTASILGESPRDEIDAEIIRVCSAKKQYTRVNLFSGLVKKTVYSMSFFLLGFAVVGYFIYNAETANTNSALYSMQPSKNAADASVLAKEIPATSEKDSTKDSAVYFSKNRGNLETNGVFPVDLK